MSDINKLLIWGAGLPFLPKIILSIIVIGVAVFILIILWRPPNETPDSKMMSSRLNESEVDMVSDQINQNTEGENSPIILGDNNEINIYQNQEMEPMIEGFTVTVQQIPSPRSDAQYALEVVVQVQANITPVSLGFFIDKPLVEGKVKAPSPLFNFIEGTLNDDPDRSYWVAFNSPPITPTQPLIVHLVANESFNVTRMVRVGR